MLTNNGVYTVFIANVYHALLGLKDCWIAVVLGMSVVLGEITSTDTLYDADVCSMVIGVDKVVEIL